MGDTTETGSVFIIDGDANPAIPEGYFIKEHVKIGNIPSDRAFAEYRVDSQLRKEITLGHDIYPEARKRVAANANVLDFYLMYPERIPEEHFNRFVGSVPLYLFFWGTIYGMKAGPDSLFVRYMRFVEKVPSSHMQCLDNEFPFYYPALVFGW